MEPPVAEVPVLPAVTVALVVLHVVVCLLLLVLILLKSGRGGGLSDLFGGGAMGGMTGSTVVERNLDRLTVAAGVVFTATTMLLALLLA
ncbi:MAG: preprotein translocase subunit SecG [Actinomycetota bacterium]|nr:preprotein translocase subunit SecG [Actinomycetota bacterium]